MAASVLKERETRIVHGCPSLIQKIKIDVRGNQWNVNTKFKLQSYPLTLLCPPYRIVVMDHLSYLLEVMLS